MRTPESVIKRPILTEKSTVLRETGGNEKAHTDAVKPQFIFEVDASANKIDIRNAVRQLWKVDVIDVRTAIVAGKVKRVGRFTGKRSNWKKATVTLAAGQNIEFFEGI